VNCREVTVAGGLGAGQVAKLANNLMSLVNTAVVAEALRLAQACGMEPGVM
jgi:3-hydroxyisobutyrate dehydrogenase-like beta-hydroxyacid dehydrogenase